MTFKLLYIATIRQTMAGKAPTNIYLDLAAEQLAAIKPYHLRSLRRASDHGWWPASLWRTSHSKQIPSLAEFFRHVKASIEHGDIKAAMQYLSAIQIAGRVSENLLHCATTNYLDAIRDEVELPHRLHDVAHEDLPQTFINGRFRRWQETSAQASMYLLNPAYRCTQEEAEESIMAGDEMFHLLMTLTQALVVADTLNHFNHKRISLLPESLAEVAEFISDEELTDKLSALEPEKRFEALADYSRNVRLGGKIFRHLEDDILETEGYSAVSAGAYQKAGEEEALYIHDMQAIATTIAHYIQAHCDSVEDAKALADYLCALGGQATVAKITNSLIIAMNDAHLVPDPVSNIKVAGLDMNWHDVHSEEGVVSITATLSFAVKHVAVREMVSGDMNFIAADPDNGQLRLITNEQALEMSSLQRQAALTNCPNLCTFTTDITLRASAGRLLAPVVSNMSLETVYEWIAHIYQAAAHESPVAEAAAPSAGAGMRS